MREEYVVTGRGRDSIVLMEKEREYELKLAVAMNGLKKIGELEKENEELRSRADNTDPTETNGRKIWGEVVKNHPDGSPNYLESRIHQFMINYPFGSERREMGTFEELSVRTKLDVREREKAFDDLIKSIERRNKEKEERNIDRWSSWLYSIQSCPGVGKTAILNYFAKRLKEERNYVCVPITFNSENTIQPNDPKEPWQMGIRVLCSVYFKSRKDAFTELKTTLFLYRTILPLLKEDVIARLLVFIFPKRNVMLLVDEVGRTGDEDTVSSYLSQIGSCLDYCKRFYSVITSLNPTVFQKFSKGSQRPFEWIEIELLKDWKMFFQKKRYDVSSSAMSIAKDCNGHARSLDQFSVYYYDNPSNHRKEYHELLTGFLQRKDFHDAIESPPKELIIACIQGRSCMMTEKFGDRLLSDWIASGFLINSSTDANTPLVPVLSPVRLLLWAKRFPEERLSYLINDIFYTLKHWDWHQFERFVAGWECLVREAYIGQTISLNQIYKRTDLPHGKLIFKAVGKATVDADISGDVIMISSRIKKKATEDDFRSKIFLGKAGTESVEFEFREDLQLGGKLMIGGQTKYSEEESSTILKRSDITKGYTSFASKMKKRH
eukprot:TRINITY_DN3163_c0_g1_i2.p1 TRINITY_DN3163_c0_g1~~TRINITY_DN3163_c0_g1_i2.p1  ORF type:complete len:607 (-),score=124.45 TRINITY_DN3163_c0_g1_i2:161-1981(-)